MAEQKRSGYQFITLVGSRVGSQFVEPVCVRNSEEKFELFAY